MKDVVKVCPILLPNDNIDLKKWAVVACDQFTSQPDYWEKLQNFCKGAESTFYLIYPEVYLEDKNKTERINKINETMKQYIENGTFKCVNDSFILVERDTPFQKSRLGLILAVDLEDYDYVPFSEVFIRATEGTVTERIPPRLEIRKNAILELPHIMLLIDDREKTVIEPLFEKKESLELLYDTDLNMNGGHLRGYRVTDTDKVIKKLYALLDENNQKKNYGKKTNFLFAVGDGNHSLATAKAHWNKVKKTISADEFRTHPARFALVEVENLHSDALKFEPIHRVIFNGGNKFLEELKNAVGGTGKLKIITAKGEYEIKAPSDSIEAIRRVQDFIDAYLKQDKDATVDYVHGSDNLIEVVKKHNGIGIVMPAPAKNDLFEYIIRMGILPRKSFSMGEAEEKRYYLEAKKIVE